MVRTIPDAVNAALAVVMGYVTRHWVSRFVRGVGALALGAEGSQAITIAIAPSITRIYGPNAFGLLGTFIAIV